MSQPPTNQRGVVYLVGAGPGDPGLVTRRAIECLGRAQLVLYDYLVNPRILEHAPTGAELVCLGRHGTGRIMPQAEINRRMVEAAMAGRTVVRLKSGDPMVFGRAAEELAALIEAGIPFEIVPGVTAAAAVSAYAGIPLTDREAASAVAFATGHESDDKHVPLDFASLAGFPGTLVLYMGVTTAADWTSALVRGGRAPHTPVAIVRRCSWPDQTTVRCTLAEVPGIVAGRHIRPPALVIIGEVAAADFAIDWFTRRPLFGKTILITRAQDQLGPLRHRLEELGACVLCQPAIRISPPVDWRPVDQAIAGIDQYDWLAFSSANGVRYFLDRLLAEHGDLRRLGRARLAVIGPGTAEALAAYRLRPDVEPSEYRAEALAAALAEHARGKRFLLLRASRGREVLADELRRCGARVDQVVVYQSIDVDQPDPWIAEALNANQVNYLTVTSSAIARSLVHLFGDSLRHTRLVSISPLTSAALRHLGHQPAIEALRYTMEGVVEAIVREAGSCDL